MAKRSRTRATSPTLCRGSGLLDAGDRRRDWGRSAGSGLGTKLGASLAVTSHSKGMFSYMASQVEELWLMARPVRITIGVLAGATILTLTAVCARAPDTGSDTASGTRTASPSPQSSATTLPDATALTAANCTAAAATSQPRLLGRYYTIRPAANWTDTGDYQHTETLFLELTAPGTYGFAPTRLDFQGGAVGPVHTIFGPDATAHSIAQQHATSIAQETSPNAVAGVVRDCSVGGVPAAAYGFTNGTISGFYIYFIHNDGLFEVFIFGTGGLSNQAIQDSLGMLGSVAWAS